MKQHVTDSLIQEAIAGRCVLFLGAGASNAAGAPSAQELAEELADAFLSGRHRNDRLAQVASYVEHTPGLGRRVLIDYMVRRLAELSPSKAHVALTRVPWTALFTTNYDTLIEDAYRSVSASTRVVRILRSADLLKTADRSQPPGIPVLKLHGCISDPYSDDTPLVISEDDYFSAERRRHGLFKWLEALKYTHTFLFVGYSFGDPELSRIWMDVQSELGRLSQWAFAVWPNHTDEQVLLWRSRYVELVDCTFSELMDVMDRSLGARRNSMAVSARTTDRLVGVRTLETVLRNCDHYLYTASIQTAELAIQIAEQLRGTDLEPDAVFQGALLSDVGLLAVPARILYKPGPLDESEWQVFQLHTATSEGILLETPGLQGIARVVRHHHERFDGLGYPDKLAGSEIPLASRVIAVARAYIALTTDLPYRAAFPKDQAITSIHESAGADFDPDVVEAFLRAMSANSGV